MKKELSNTNLQMNKIKADNEVFKSQSESYRSLATSILEKTYRNIPNFVSIKKELAISNLNVDEVASSLREVNDELATHFSGILLTMME